MLRELAILRKLSKMDSNMYITKIYDVIVPDEAIVEEDSSLSTEDHDDDTLKVVHGSKDETEGSDEENEEESSVVNLKKLTHLFIVMEKCQSDFKNMLENTPKNEINEDHIVTILYN